jgi:hypothetical protein
MPGRPPRRCSARPTRHRSPKHTGPIELELKRKLKVPTQLHMQDPTTVLTRIRKRSVLGSSG